MDKTEFIGKLQLCYVGDRNAFDEIVGEYDRLNNKIEDIKETLNDFMQDSKDVENEWAEEICKIILKKCEVINNEIH